MRNLSKKSKAIIVGAAIAGLASAGGAYAYWTTTGTGSGNASTTAGVSGLSNLVSGDLTPALFPGQVAQSLSYTVTNPGALGAQSIYVTHVFAYLTVVPVSGTCDSSDYKIEGIAGTTSSAPVELASWVAQDLPGAAAVTKTTTVQFVNKPSNQDDCKSAAVTIHYVAN